MGFLDLIKATVGCGGCAFVVYTYPAVGQGLIIALLTLLWLLYARQTWRRCRRH